MTPSDETPHAARAHPDTGGASAAGFEPRWIGSSVGSILAAAAEEAQRLRAEAEADARRIRADAGDTMPERRAELAALEAQIARARAELDDLRRSIAAAALADLAASGDSPRDGHAAPRPVARREVSTAIGALDAVIEIDLDDVDAGRAGVAAQPADA